MGSEIGSEVIPRDQRGRHVPANKLDLQPVIDHIESFNPTCQKWLQHRESAVQSRAAYQADAERTWPEDTSVRSVDLKKNKKTNISVVWHEGVAGHSAGEIASAYVVAVEKERDLLHSVFWVDNCSAQNKNWCLLSTLVSLVNGSTNSREDITLEFFEKGHTFMSADSVHHGVEQEMRKRPGGYVFDFEDFVSVVASSNSKKVEVIEMENANVLKWKDGHSAAKTKKAPKLSQMAEIQLRCGSRSLFFKHSHRDCDFPELDFLLAKFDLKMPPPLRSHDRGIEKTKKEDILKKLCPLMPPNRRAFWLSLLVE
ncbi:hypothetical protein F2P79_018678 [Pimephales promelas]|nr:hypothetical protein F2P79_018678 [Pimephales promelas]